MINYIWAFMIIAGVIWGGLKGQAAIYVVSENVINSAGDAITLGMTLLGVVGLWCGVMRIAEEAGLTEKWANMIQPAITFLFPDIPDNHPVRKDISTNLLANILGLGWAATPAGLKAMRGLAEIDKNGHGFNTMSDNFYSDSQIASNSMCTLLVINISSLQLIPVNIIAYRMKYQSINATAIIGPSILATLISTITAIIFCKLACKR